MKVQPIPGKLVAFELFDADYKWNWTLGVIRESNDHMCVVQPYSNVDWGPHTYKHLLGSFKTSTSSLRASQGEFLDIREALNEQANGSYVQFSFQCAEMSDCMKEINRNRERVKALNEDVRRTEAKPKLPPQSSLFRLESERKTILTSSIISEFFFEGEEFVVLTEHEIDGVQKACSVYVPTLLKDSSNLMDQTILLHSELLCLRKYTDELEKRMELQENALSDLYISTVSEYQLQKNEHDFEVFTLAEKVKDMETLLGPLRWDDSICMVTTGHTISLPLSENETLCIVHPEELKNALAADVSLCLRLPIYYISSVSASSTEMGLEASFNIFHSVEQSISKINECIETFCFPSVRYLHDRLLHQKLGVDKAMIEVAMSLQMDTKKIEGLHFDEFLELLQDIDHGSVPAFESEIGDLLMFADKLHNENRSLQSTLEDSAKCFKEQMLRGAAKEDALNKEIEHLKDYVEKLQQLSTHQEEEIEDLRNSRDDKYLQERLSAALTTRNSRSVSLINPDDIPFDRERIERLIKENDSLRTENENMHKKCNILVQAQGTSTDNSHPSGNKEVEKSIKVEDDIQDLVLQLAEQLRAKGMGKEKGEATQLTEKFLVEGDDTSKQLHNTKNTVSQPANKKNTEFVAPQSMAMDATEVPQRQIFLNENGSSNGTIERQSNTRKDENKEEEKDESSLEKDIDLVSDTRQKSSNNEQKTTSPYHQSESGEKGSHDPENECTEKAESTTSPNLPKKTKDSADTQNGKKKNSLKKKNKKNNDMNNNKEIPQQSTKTTTIFTPTAKSEEKKKSADFLNEIMTPQLREELMAFRRKWHDAHSARLDDGQLECAGASKLDSCDMNASIDPKAIEKEPLYCVTLSELEAQRALTARAVPREESAIEANPGDKNVVNVPASVLDEVIAFRRKWHDAHSARLDDGQLECAGASKLDSCDMNASIDPKAIEKEPLYCVTLSELEAQRALTARALSLLPVHSGHLGEAAGVLGSEVFGRRSPLPVGDCLENSVGVVSGAMSSLNFDCGGGASCAPGGFFGHSAQNADLGGGSVGDEGRLSAETVSTPECEKLRRRIEELENTLMLKGEETSSLGGELEVLKARAEALFKELCEANERHRRLLGDLECFARDHTCGGVKDVLDKLGTRELELMEVCHLRLFESFDYMKELCFLRAKSDFQEKRIAEEETQREHLLLDNNLLRRELEKTRALLKLRNNKISELGETLEVALTDIKDLEDELNEKSLELSDTLEKLEEISGMLREAREGEVSLLKLREDSDSEIFRLQRELDKLKSAHTALTEAYGSRDKIAGKFVTVQQELQDSLESITEKDRMIHQLEVEYHDIEESHEVMKKNYEKTIDRLQSEAKKILSHVNDGFNPEQALRVLSELISEIS